VGISCADHVTPSTRKSRHYFVDSGGRSVGIVRLRTKATEFKVEDVLVLVKYLLMLVTVISSFLYYKFAWH
jgi:hypothetical protein